MMTATNHLPGCRARKAIAADSQHLPRRAEYHTAITVTIILYPGNHLTIGCCY